MKKFFLVIFLICVSSVAVFCFLKCGHKDFKEYSFVNNKNHEYVLSIIKSSADDKKKNYLSDFYFDKAMYNVQCTMYNKRQELRKIRGLEDWKIGRRNDRLPTDTFGNDRPNNDKDAGSQRFARDDRHNYNVIHQVRDDSDRLIEKYNNLLKKNKKINPVTRAEIYYFVGNMYWKKKEYSNAVYCYKKALFFAPYCTETKYGINNFVNFIEKINVPEKLLEYNYDKSIKQLQIFIQNKENSLDKQVKDIKKELKNIYAKNIKLNENIKISCIRNKDSLNKEIYSIQKEKENIEKRIKLLQEKSSKQEISEINSIKKEILKDFSDIAKFSIETLSYWEKLEKAVIRRISKNLENTERKNLHDKYFVTDMFLHRKNTGDNLLDIFINNSGTEYDNIISRNVFLINYYKQSIFNDLKENCDNMLVKIIEIDEKAAGFFTRRAKHLSEEKENISVLLKDISSKRKDIQTILNSGSNAQNKKNLQRELDKLKEKEKSLRQESVDCDKDISELETIKENIIMYNEINFFEIKNYIITESMAVNKSLTVVNEYIKTFCELQKGLLNSQQEILKNINNFDYTNLKKFSGSLFICDNNFINMTAEYKCLCEQQKLLISNYTDILTKVKQSFEATDNDEIKIFFGKFKSFIEDELKFCNDMKKISDKVFDCGEIFASQTDIMAADLKAKRKLEKLEDILEIKNAIKNLFPKKQEHKVIKSKKHQKQEIVPQIKNYEVNTEQITEQVQEEVPSEIKEEKKIKKEKKKKKKKK